MAYGPGDVVAGYTIERLLGKGGMGSVYLAKHPRLPRHDALKLLSPHLFEDETYRARFEREADVAAGVSHRNIVAVYDRGSESGQLWIAMQYVQGIDAAKALAGGKPMHAQRAAHIIAEAATGLDFAHRHGLVHRDVKPANILLSPGVDKDDAETVMLADFGIAKSSTESLSLTGTGVFLGTLSYAAPELLDGRPADHRVDIYSLGCVLFELLTGRVPFQVPNPLAAINAHLTSPVPAPSTVTFGIPEALDSVVARAMAKDPNDRFQNAREMAIAARAAIVAAGPARPASGTVALGADLPRPPYWLTVRRYGDGAGEVLGPVDTADLSNGERSALETLLHASAFFELPLRMPLVRQVPGDQYMELTVGGGGRERTVGFERLGSRIPLEFPSIIDRLTNLAQWRPTTEAPAVSHPMTSTTAIGGASAAAQREDIRTPLGTPAAAPSRPRTPPSQPAIPLPATAANSAPAPTIAAPHPIPRGPGHGATAHRPPQSAAGAPFPAPGGPDAAGRAWWQGPPGYLLGIGLVATLPFYLWTVVAGLIATVVVIGAVGVLAVLYRGGS